ncbi:MAG: hypothetical protein KDA63_14630, partial [Planctomycetales bacterium]|nr:hypothetical protein [Planctomycetales bacterium]
THWVYSQYGLRDHEIIADRDYRTPPPWDDGMYRHRPSEAMAMVYDRRTFHARPRNYYQVFQETTEFTIGDVAYSEGHHDHANNWIYQRLFWNPHQSVEAVVHEYARAHFGSEAADLMTAAIFTLEENLQTPIAENDGIDRLVELVESAGRVMPAERRRRSYLWHEYLEKACLDKYIQLDVRRQRALVDSVSTQLAAALEGGDLAATLSALAETSLPAPSDEMEALKARAVAAGGESERIFGLRSEGLFNLVQDYVGFGWLQHEIVRAVMAENERDRRAFVERILHYDDPGHDGFYDNAGVPGEAPHLVYGWSYGDGEFNSSNRRSQRTMAFTTDEERGVAFRYTDLDPDAEYRVRLTLVRPRFLPRYAKFQPQTRQSIYADDFLLAENLELPEYRADSFEFDVPRAATADGELRLWMKKQAGVGEGLPSDVSIWRNTGGWGTLVSEVWLMKKPDVAAAAE